MIYAVSDIHGDLAMYNHIVNMLKGDDILYIVGNEEYGEHDNNDFLQYTRFKEN